MNLLLLSLKLIYFTTSLQATLELLGIQVNMQNCLKKSPKTEDKYVNPAGSRSNSK